MVFYPVYKLPSWLATALRMLRKAGILLVRAQGSVTQAMAVARCQQFHFPHSQRCDSEGARDIPQAPHFRSCTEFSEQEAGSSVQSKFPCSFPKGSTGCTVFQGCSPLDFLWEDNTEQGSQHLYSPKENNLQHKVFSFLKKKNYGKCSYITQILRRNKWDICVPIYCILYILYCIYYIMYHVAYIFKPLEKGEINVCCLSPQSVYFVIAV